MLGSSPGDRQMQLMRLVIVTHALTAGALIIASVLAFRFVGVLSLWLGVPVGLILYAITLVLAKADGDEEAS
jgi:hypothetical protein